MVCCERRQHGKTRPRRAISGTPFFRHSPACHQPRVGPDPRGTAACPRNRRSPSRRRPRPWLKRWSCGPPASGLAVAAQPAVPEAPEKQPLRTQTVTLLTIQARALLPPSERPAQEASAPVAITHRCSRDRRGVLRPAGVTTAATRPPGLQGWLAALSASGVQRLTDAARPTAAWHGCWPPSAPPSCLQRRTCAAAGGMPWGRCPSSGGTPAGATPQRPTSGTPAFRLPGTSGARGLPRPALLLSGRAQPARDRAATLAARPGGAWQDRTETVYGYQAALARLAAQGRRLGVGAFLARA